MPRRVPISFSHQPDNRNKQYQVIHVDWTTSVDSRDDGKLDDIYIYISALRRCTLWY